MIDEKNELAESLLEGLRQDAENPNAEDERFMDRASDLDDEDMLLPPQDEDKPEKPQLPPTRLKSLNGYQVKSEGESYFAECERDELGRCLPKGSVERPKKEDPAVEKAVEKYGPVLAEMKQNGYTMRIHDLHIQDNKPARITDSARNFEGAGQITIESPEGEIVEGAKWMDWAEEHYPKNYVDLPKNVRAAMELEEQKKYGYEHTFKFQKQRAAEKPPDMEAIFARIANTKLPPTKLKSLLGYATKDAKKENCRWVTLEDSGTHICIGSGGRVDKGPKNLEDKPLGNKKPQTPKAKSGKPKGKPSEETNKKLKDAGVTSIAEQEDVWKTEAKNTLENFKKFVESLEKDATEAESKGDQEKAKKKRKVAVEFIENLDRLQKKIDNPPVSVNEGEMLRNVWAEEASPEQIKALKRYADTENYFVVMNKSLRTGKPAKGEDKTAIDEMSELFKKIGSLPEPVKVYRGMGLSSKLQKELIPQFKKALLSGKPLTMKGFTSTSFDPDVAESLGEGLGTGSNNYLFEITAKKGIYVDGVVPGKDREWEMILDHESKFRVSKIEGNKIYMEQVL